MDLPTSTWSQIEVTYHSPRMPLELVATDEISGIVVFGSSSMNMDNNVSKCCIPTELGDNNPRTTAKNESYTLHFNFRHVAHNV